MILTPLLVAAVLIVAIGIALWVYDSRLRRKNSMQRHLQNLLELRAGAMRDGLMAQEITAATTIVSLNFGPAWLRHPSTLRLLGWIIGGTSLVVLPLFGLSYWGAAITIWLSVVTAGTLWSWRRWHKLRQKVLLQLPAFIDGMVRMVALGHASQSAFLQAAETTQAPLYETLGQAVAFAKAGMPLEEAISKSSQHWDLTDFAVLAAVLRLCSRYGGRLDALLERIAGFIRDREAATQELHALSTEVRLSAWILGLLPVVVGGVIIASNFNYFYQTWVDPAGKSMLVIAAMLQIVGVFMLYRVARLG